MYICGDGVVYKRPKKQSYGGTTAGPGIIIPRIYPGVREVITGGWLGERGSWHIECFSDRPDPDSRPDPPHSRIYIAKGGW